MKQKFFIVLGLAVLIIVLIGLNALSYTQKETEPDTEFYPNRSTYNLGSTGTRAFFDLLNETGRNPVRWQKTTAELLTAGKNKPATFVIIGRLRNELTDEESVPLLQWVSEGGRLVVIDREPPKSLVKTTANWNIAFSENYSEPGFMTDASDQKQMTAGVKAAKPAQPTIYTKGINGVQASRYASSIYFNHMSDEEVRDKKVNRRTSKPTPFPTFTKATPKYETPPNYFPTPTPTPVPNTYATPKPKSQTNGSGTGSGSGLGSGSGSGSGSGRGQGSGDGYSEPVFTPKPTPAPPNADGRYETSALSAPVIHLNTDSKNLLVEVPYGSGKIVYLSDPYIVANGGINLVDNAQLAINIVTPREGVIAFDEYHQGFGSNTNQFFKFFAGTPVVSIFLQLALIVGLIFFSQSRRFARAVPEPEPNRLSKLEYVAAMAELQRRTKGYDLAIENIYTDFRRRVSRLVGVDAFKTRRQDLALLIVERLPDENADEIEALMKRCEDVMHGDASGKKEVLRLTTRLRELEEKLGLQRRKRQKKAL